MEHIEVQTCPACNHNRFKDFLLVKDHFLSGEEFRLMKCDNCDLVFTQPRPSSESIGEYYKSEDYVSHSSTKKGLVNRAYNFVRSITLNQKRRLVEGLVSGKSILDIGAGTGHFLSEMSKAGFDVVGLEPDLDARRVARESNHLELLPLEELDNLQAESFDVVTMWHVLEHVYNLQADLKRIDSLIKPDGVLLIAVPNHTSYDANHYDSFWAAYDVPRHLYHFEPKTIVPLVERFGLKFEKMLPMKFDSYYVSMLSEKYKGGGILSALRVGFLSNWKSSNGKCSSQIYIFRK